LKLQITDLHTKVKNLRKENNELVVLEKKQNALISAQNLLSQKNKKSIELYESRLFAELSTIKSSEEIIEKQNQIIKDNKNLFSKYNAELNNLRDLNHELNTTCGEFSEINKTQM